MRLLSYNIHKGIGGRDRRYRLERIIEVIETENPDIICLQEVDRHVRRTRYDDQPALLQQYFRPATHLYQLNVHLKDGGYGNLLLARWPLLSKHQISLRHERRRPRGAQLAVIQTPEGPVHIVHWHLGLAERERHWQMGHLLGHAAFRENERRATLLVGDSNDWRNTLQKAALGRCGFHQVTAPISKFRTFPAYFAIGSLDKAYGRGIRVRHARIVRTPLSRSASDHLPLVIDFHLEPK